MSTHYVLSADIASVGKKRLRVFEQDDKTARRLQPNTDTAALEQIFNSCSAAAVKDVENVLMSLEEEQARCNQSNNGAGSMGQDFDPTSRILLRYAVLSEAFRREQQSNAILQGALETALRAVEEARDELCEVKAERDALRQAISEQKTQQHHQQQHLSSSSSSSPSRRIL